MKEPIQIQIHNSPARARLEAIKQENPTLWNEIREYLSPEGLRKQLAEGQGCRRSS